MTASSFEQQLPIALSEFPRLKGKCTEHLCMDKAYDSRAIRQMLQQEFGYTPHIRSRMESGFQKSNRQSIVRVVG